MVLVGRVRWSSRGKDAGSPDSGAIGATEDAASRRPARRGGTVLSVRQTSHIVQTPTEWTRALRGQGLSAADLDELWAGLVEEAVRRGGQAGDGKWTAQAWRHETQEVIARVRKKVETALDER